MMPPRGALRALVRLALACGILAASAGTAFAQLDPLLFMKTSKPNVLLVVDTANRMQRDANNDYYDQFTYRQTNANWEPVLGVTNANTFKNYRRKYINLGHLDTSLNTDKFSADTIRIVGDQDPGYATFEARTRMSIARQALIRAIQLNLNVARFGLIKMRQANPALGAQGNEGPVKVADANQQSPTESGNSGKWEITRPTVSGPNGYQAAVTAPVYKSDSATANSDILNYLARTPDAGGLLPAGTDAVNMADAPVKYMLDDAKAEAGRLIGGDTSYRNTVVVLVVGGPEGSTSGQDPVSTAASFRNISGRRVPIYVIALAVTDAAAVAQLQAIATSSGGQYIGITSAMINAVAAGSPVPEIVRGVNTAVQHTFASFTDFNTAPSAALPYGPSTEYQVTSPIVGTVNLANALDINGAALPNTLITERNGNIIPQRSNVIVTTGVAVPGDISTPGFPGKLRAFRVYRPVADSTKASGYKFVGDGTALWVARPPTAGEGSRNIFTVLPDGTMTAFTPDNAAALQPYLRDSDPAGLIAYVRGLPLGAFLDATPAFLDAPSLDPPPDPEYPGFKDLCEGRRTMIFIGGNDGMLHGIDARTGVEVWAFIPSNLLPKLRALREGQPVDQFRFFVDGSPKVADVKVGGQWRTYMMFGEGPGGTFYQVMDVTMSDLAAAVPQDSGDVSGLLNYFSNPARIPFKWSFPLYSHFDYTLSTPATPYGDLDKDRATAIEKSVGQTWSDPAVGEVQNSSGSWVALVGSGFLPYSQQSQANRANAPAGTTFYIIDMGTGAILDARDVGNDRTAETLDNCAVSGNCTNQKNAVQSDPVATGPPNSRFIDTTYIGDLDGRLWRFSLGLNGARQATITAGPVKLFDAGASQPIFSSMAVVNVGSTQQYIFFGSGSDLLPSTGVSQSYKLFSVLDQNGTGVQKFAIQLAAVDGVGDDEKVSAFPAVAGDIVFFTTTSYKGATPWLQPDANVYAMTFIGGPAYDNTGDNAVTGADTPKVKTFAAGGRATAPFVADQHLVIGTNSGKVEFFGDPEDFNNGVGQVGVRILSWREVR